MAEADLRAQLSQIFASQSDDRALLSRLNALATADPIAFEQAADQWAIPLYDRSIYVFGEFITTHLTKTRQDVIEQLLIRLEADQQDAFFTILYAKIATPDYWRADVRRLLTTLSEPALSTALSIRLGYGWSFPDDSIVRLYDARFTTTRENLTLFSQIFGYSRADNRLVTLDAIHALTHDQNHHIQNWFWGGASPDEVRRHLQWLLENGADDIKAQLDALRLTVADFDLGIVLENALITRFGEPVRLFIRKHSSRYFLKQIREAIQTITDNQLLRDRINVIVNVEFGRLHLNRTFCNWALPLYERDATFFASFIVDNLQTGHPPNCLPDLIDRAWRDGNGEFVRQLYGQAGDSALWNADLRRIARYTPPERIAAELNQMDVRRKPRRYPAFSLFLDPETARLLYGAAPDHSRTAVQAIQTFIWQYLPESYRVVQQKLDYSALLDVVAARAESDDEAEAFYLRLLRRVATPQAWEGAMRHLLAQDIPSDRIVAELEKRKPANPAATNSAILSAFLAKYGAALMPFLQNYLDWTQPARLQSLLDLPIDRADLLRELQAIARRQPIEFSQRADIWAIALYERSPEYFGSFLLRQLNWNSRPVIDRLLMRIEADGRDTLFKQIYSRFYRRSEDWSRDLALLLRSPLDNAALLKALTLRNETIGSLPNPMAVELYARDPQLFGAFVLAHLDPAGGYTKLRPLAIAAGDTALIAATADRRPDDESESTNQARLRAAIESLLARNVPPESIGEAMQPILALMKAFIKKMPMKALISLVARYGDPMIDLLFGSDGHLAISLRSDGSTFVDGVAPYIGTVTYWRLVRDLFMTERWIDGLKALATQPIDRAVLRQQLAAMMPDRAFAEIPPDLALALYRRDADVMRPLLLQNVSDLPNPALFQAAVTQGDSVLADTLTYRLLISVQRWKAGGYPGQFRSTSRQKTTDKEQVDALYAQAIDRSTAWLRDLHKADPSTYIRHCANILSQIQPFDLAWWGKTQRENTNLLHDNPIWQALTQTDAAAWRGSAEGIAQVLEAPNWNVLRFALDLLAADGRDSAPRVSENQRTLRVILLSTTLPRDLKFKVLAVLEAVGTANPEQTTSIVDLLHGALDFQARRAISDDIAQTIVRLQAIPSTDSTALPSEKAAH